MLPPKEDLSAKRLQSPMPGKVISVAVKEGDVVEAGQVCASFYC
jgi:biotin carboxyl carrier protein